MSLHADAVVRDCEAMLETSSQLLVVQRPAPEQAPRPPAATTTLSAYEAIAAVLRTQPVDNLAFARAMRVVLRDWCPTDFDDFTAHAEHGQAWRVRPRVLYAFLNAAARGSFGQVRVVRPSSLRFEVLLTETAPEIRLEIGPVRMQAQEEMATAA